MAESKENFKLDIRSDRVKHFCLFPIGNCYSIKSIKYILSFSVKFGVPQQKFTNVYIKGKGQIRKLLQPSEPFPPLIFLY